GLGICGLVRPLLVLVGAGYVALTLTYSMVWRHILLLDIVAIAGGFLLRAVAGGVAAPVRLSRWFLLVVTFAAIFVAAGKRWSGPGGERLPRSWCCATPDSGWRRCCGWCCSVSVCMPSAELSLPRTPAQRPEARTRTSRVSGWGRAGGTTVRLADPDTLDGLR